jgi:SAM-dependent methyltransferase
MRQVPDPRPVTLDRAAVGAEMDQARADFNRLVSDATAADLRRPSEGTRWTNQQLLFHMLFGYLVVRALLVLVRIFDLLPDPASKAFAQILDATHRPFHLINYLGSCVGARVIPPRRMIEMLDRVIAALQQRLQREPEAALRRGMHYPTTWDPFFADYMTLADIYSYPTRHFRYHQRQLTLGRATPSAAARPAAATAGKGNKTGSRAGSRPGAGLTPHQAKRFYDRLGKAQDLQAFYEDQPVAELITAAYFPAARSVFELGCGTGRLAENLLTRHLPPDARYLGTDISDTMAVLSQTRLRRFSGRAHVLRADATAPLPLTSGEFDRFLAVYVLDLLSPRDARAVIAQARRLLRPGGLLCAVSLAPGQTPAARLISRTWTRLWTRAPGLVGGCRPTRLEPLLDGWHITHLGLVTAWALTSEVIVATPSKPTAPAGKTPALRRHPRNPETEDPGQ